MDVKLYIVYLVATGEVWKTYDNYSDYEWDWLDNTDLAEEHNLDDSDWDMEEVPIRITRNEDGRFMAYTPMMPETM